jgi:hypothetical protein
LYAAAGLSLLCTTLISCNSSQETWVIENTAPVKTTEAPIPEEKYLSFECRYFSLKYPDSWVVDPQTDPSSPSYFSAHFGKSASESISLISMILMNDKHMDIEDFADDFANKKFTTTDKSNALIQSIQMQPYRIVNSYKRTNIDKGFASFYFYEIDREHILCLQFYGIRNALSPQIEKAKDVIVHSVQFSKIHKIN